MSLFEILIIQIPNNMYHQIIYHLHKVEFYYLIEDQALIIYQPKNINLDSKQLGKFRQKIQMEWEN